MNSPFEEHESRSQESGRKPKPEFNDLSMNRPLAPVRQLQLWYEQYFKRPDWNEVRVLESTPERASIQFSSTRFTYTVHADTEEESGYLGCTCTENGQQRGCDLPDGPMTDETWREIVTAVMEQEGDL